MLKAAMAGCSSERSTEEVHFSSKSAKLDTDPEKMNLLIDRKVPVVYYLSRNGQLDHPHFMEVSLSASQGLYLRDVITRLKFLRGKGMASLYSWSSKRSYKNSFVWHDLEENDFISPPHGHDEYVLKGTELIGTCTNPIVPLIETRPTRMLRKRAEVQRFSFSGEVSKQRQEFKVCKSDAGFNSSRNLSVDASTQTDEIEGGKKESLVISPPSPNSSVETLDSLLKMDARSIKDGRLDLMAENSGRGKKSTLLMHLISCGLFSVGNPTAVPVKESSNKPRLSRGGEIDPGRDSLNFPQMRLMDKEFFSGSLIEIKKKDVIGFKRSKSCNTDR